MKKNLLLLTGIVFLITVLAAGGCNKGKMPIGSTPKDFIKDSTKVKIYLKAIKIEGEIHLKMYDSNKRRHKVVDTLETFVPPGSTVIWKRTWFSGIKKIEKIGSTSGDGNIFKEDAQPIPNSKRFKLEIPKNVSPGEVEEYDIEFLDKDSNPQSIDPYLRIPYD